MRPAAAAGSPRPTRRRWPASASTSPRSWPGSRAPTVKEPWRAIAGTAEGGSRHRPFTGGAKSILEKSLRVALGRRDRFIGEEHLLLALTACPGVVADVLAEHGATYAAVERALYGDGGEGRTGELTRRCWGGAASGRLARPGPPRRIWPRSVCPWPGPTSAGSASPAVRPRSPSEPGHRPTGFGPGRTVTGIRTGRGPSPSPRPPGRAAANRCASRPWPDAGGPPRAGPR